MKLCFETILQKMVFSLIFKLTLAVASINNSFYQSHIMDKPVHLATFRIWQVSKEICNLTNII